MWSYTSISTCLRGLDNISKHEVHLNIYLTRNFYSTENMLRSYC
jgi:hypothetical protein